MLNIPEVIKELFLQDGIRKNFRVHFPNGERADLVNKDIVGESVKFTESVCSQQRLRFGLTEASVIEFECVGVENIAGMTIECGIEIDVSSLPRASREAYGTRTADVAFPFYAVPYGVFVVDKCPRQVDMKRRKVTAYTINVGTVTAPISIASKANKLTFSLSNYLDKVSVSPDNAEELLVITTDALYVSMRLGTSTTPNFNLYCRDVVRWAYAKTPTYYVDTPIMIRCDFIPDMYDDGGMDEYADLIYDAAPSETDFVYDKDSPSRQYQNTAQAVAARLGAVRPHAIVTMNNGHCYPIFFKSGEPFIVNPSDQTYLYGSTVQGGYYVTVFVPIAWRQRGYWGSESGTLSGINLGDDFVEKERPAPSVYVKTGEPLDTYYGQWLELTTDNTVNFRGLGEYRSFEEFSGEDFAEQMLTLYGGFGCNKRDGSVEVKALSRDAWQYVSPSTIESMWYDEGETEVIGYAVIEVNGEYDVVQTRFPALGPGVYDMGAPMWVNFLAGPRGSYIRGWLILYFRDNAAASHYTPIDLKMKGLPWLEDGDAIRIETADGEIIDSFILRHTISGVQHLVDEIDAQGEV